MQQIGSGIGQATLACQSLGRAIKAPDLLRQRQRKIGRVICIGEMRHQCDIAHCIDRLQSCMGCTKNFRFESQPIHAAVHFQMNINR